MANVLTALMYGIVAWWMVWVCLHYTRLSLSLAGIAFHLFIVAVRVTVQLVVPGADTWNWGDIHRVTISIAAACAVWGGLRLWRWEYR